jgi:hypothetical protein
MGSSAKALQVESLKAKRATPYLYETDWAIGQLLYGIPYQGFMPSRHAYTVTLPLSYSQNERTGDVWRGSAKQIRSPCHVEVVGSRTGLGSYTGKSFLSFFLDFFPLLFLLF